MTRTMVSSGYGWNDGDKKKDLRRKGFVRSIYSCKDNKDAVLRMRFGDRIFLLNGKMKNNHPIYKEAVRQRRKNSSFDFYAEEVKYAGSKGLLLTCTSASGIA
jgi:hypothetical protein